MAFTESTYHALMSHGSTTTQTVLDSDGKLKNALHNEVLNTDLSDTDFYTHEGLDSVAESGTGAKGKARYLLTEDTSSGSHRVYDAFDAIAGDYYKASADYKSNGREFSINFTSTRFGTSVGWAFDPATETLTQLTGGTKDAAFFTPLGDDEYRIDLYAQATSSGSANVFFNLLDGTTANYTGDGSSGAYLSRPRVMKASVHAPVERAANGDFATDTIWTKGTNATISGGTLSYAGGSGNTDTYQTIGAQTVGDTIRVEFTVSNYVQGSVQVRTSGGASTTQNANGTYVETIVLTGAGGTLYVDPSADFVGDVDDVSWTKVITDGVQPDSDGEDFMATDGAAVYSDGVAYDGNGACLGLQAFEGRTNLITESHDLSTWNVWSGGLTVTDNDAVGPDGDLSMSKLARVDANSNGIREQLTLAASTTYVYAAFWQAGDAARSEMLIWDINASASVARLKFDWTAGVPSTQLDTGASNVKYEDWGGGLYRISFTFTTAATVTDHNVILSPETNGSGTEYAYAGLADVSKGASVAPYIPTNGAAATRSATSCYKAVSEFGYRQDEGTVVATFQSAGETNARVFQADDGVGGERDRLTLLINSSSQVRQFSRVDNSNTVDINTGTYTADAVSTIAAAWKADDSAGSLDGAAPVTDTSGGLTGNVSVMRVGTNLYDNSTLNGYIKKLVYYPSRLADATLVEESS